MTFTLIWITTPAITSPHPHLHPTPHPHPLPTYPSKRKEKIRKYNNNYQVMEFNHSPMKMLFVDGRTSSTQGDDKQTQRSSSQFKTSSTHWQTRKCILRSKTTKFCFFRRSHFQLYYCISWTILATFFRVFNSWVILSLFLSSHL